MMTVYGDIRSGNCFKVKLLMMQLGIAHDWEVVDVVRKETRTAAFLAKNPNGQIPLLELDDGRMLPESNAILQFLANGSPLWPEDRWEQAQVLRWMFFEQYTHEPCIASARFIVRYLGRPAEREAALQAKLADAGEILGVMERHLAANPFFVGGRYTIADIALYAYTHVAHEGLIDLAPFPAILAWLARVKAQPGYVGMDQFDAG